MIGYDVAALLQAKQSAACSYTSASLLHGQQQLASWYVAQLHWREHHPGLTISHADQQCSWCTDRSTRLQNTVLLMHILWKRLPGQEF